MEMSWTTQRPNDLMTVSIDVRFYMEHNCSTETVFCINSCFFMEVLRSVKGHGRRLILYWIDWPSELNKYDKNESDGDMVLPIAIDVFAPVSTTTPI